MQNPVRQSSHQITLLSDFGLKDVYVGVMKGVIAQITPNVPVIDLTHQIPPQNVLAGRFALLNAYPYFPRPTVHIAVVDPGVGSQRRAVAVEFPQGVVVAPDNGLVSGICQFESPLAAVELNNPDYWRTLSPSRTFHGRDIFSPVGAYLATGVPLQEVGTSIDPQTLVKLDLAPVTETAEGIRGTVQYIDYFGNVITNIPAACLTGKSWSVELPQQTLPQSETYSDRTPGHPVALIGSHGWLEIAVNEGNAATQLNLTYNSSVLVRW
ncbi:SAM-dependent chlorinase/fluorinase [Spirulina sp. CS-785/01]|uniref:SAM hydrolase/SAM-dependent halogenase family protein n=1 Tax=Spirulina sp. CS-785/01 TaxID=3021716 RepID=UPI00232CA24F|nr:SAM-dependent chlorinase/fluorinase [Spirulina sp. CS-785/01]MDB9311641.1 SAM-dependent chlorinase/fluorinase [Spirulina sp. CS-785/01]